MNNAPTSTSTGSDILAAIHQIQVVEQWDAQMSYEELTAWIDKATTLLASLPEAVPSGVQTKRRPARKSRISNLSLFDYLWARKHFNRQIAEAIAVRERIMIEHELDSILTHCEEMLLIKGQRVGTWKWEIFEDSLEAVIEIMHRFEATKRTRKTFTLRILHIFRVFETKLAKHGFADLLSAGTEKEARETAEKLRNRLLDHMIN